MCVLYLSFEPSTDTTLNLSIKAFCSSSLSIFMNGVSDQIENDSLELCILKFFFNPGPQNVENNLFRVKTLLFL